MGTEMVPETVSFDHLIQLMAQEYCSKFHHFESFNSYDLLWIWQIWFWNKDYLYGCCTLFTRNLFI